MENEGMRNVASHIVRELEGMCTLRRSALGNPALCLKNSIGADATVIFARASAKTAALAKILRTVCRNLWFVLVQKPEDSFMQKMGKTAAKLSYFTIIPEDADELCALGAVVKPLGVGINRDKFRPTGSAEEIAELREKYGFAQDKPLVIHVGHLSAGRGLEEFLHLPKEKYQRLVVASGMFNSDEVEAALTADGVRIIKEYLPDVSEVYRMADAYLFPTRSAQFVISIPLSVTEALACGVPVVAFGGVAGMKMIEAAQDAVITVSDSTEIEDAVRSVIEKNSGERHDLLQNFGAWNDAAREMFEGLFAGREN